jgi:VanZ family protein
MRTYLVAWYVLFIVYGSLSPFTGWRDQGLSFWAVLTAPLWQTYSLFDAIINLLAYLPFGLLLGFSFRARFNTALSLAMTTLSGIMLSAAMEYTQMYLPTRTSSNLDLLNNSISTLAGALLAVSIAPRAWFALHLTRWRHHMFHNNSSRDYGLALVVLWMFAQINPSLPMLGNVFISEVIHPLFAKTQAEPFSWLESIAVSLNLLMLGSILLILLRQHRHAVGTLLIVLCTVALTKFFAAAILLKSWALLLWLNSEAIFGIFTGAMLLFLASQLPRAHLPWLSAFVSLAYLVLAHFILDNGSPSAAMKLYHWNEGHLLNYNGLSQTITLVFPFLVLGFLWRVKIQLSDSV